MARYDTRTQGVRERIEVRRWPSAKALEQPGSFDLGVIACASERVMGQRRPGVALYQEPVLAMLVQGSAGGSASPA
jgi:hypothetical protein